jgi:hypothetical protein
MGCDIEVHAEVLIDRAWHHYSTATFDRNYRLFTKMAGVRSQPEWDIKPIAPPRGLPMNLSAITKIAALKGKGHTYSHSWLSSKEIALTEKWLIENATTPSDAAFPSSSIKLGWLFGGAFWGFEKYRSDYPREIQDVRWVFWFDN